ncbi:MAG TPA: hypothetical protein VFS33_10310 [Gemmatimonadales bacterium]|nr:hypothetical protein [Gemmatimonadales bacterium]
MAGRALASALRTRARRGTLLAGLCLAGRAPTPLPRALPSHLVQQPAVAAGTVIRARGADSTALAGARVLLHRIGRAGQGPIDSTRSDGTGRFRFRFSADTGSIYLVSATYGGIEYFSPPVHINPARPDTALRVVVSDTSSTQRIDLEARHLVISAPRRDGTRAALDLLVLNNPGDRTRISTDSLHPAWEGPLPKGSIGLDVGEGDYSAAAVQRRDDRVAFFAPIGPGEKQLVVDYVLPANQSTVELPMEQPVGLVNLLLEERNARVLTPGLQPADTEVIEGKTYHRWTGALRAGDTLRVKLPGGGGPAPRWLLPVLVAVVAAGLGAAAWFLLPGPGGVAKRVAPPHGGDADVADALVIAIAQLDERYAGREAQTDPGEWERYRVERDRLKAKLEAALAHPPRRS